MHRILIADDHAAIRRALRMLFDSSGFEVCGEAVNGRDAVEKAQELRPDLVLLDCSMPVMDGLAASRELTRLMPELPLIMLTSYGGSVMEEDARKAGVRKVISKDQVRAQLMPDLLKILV